MNLNDLKEILAKVLYLDEVDGIDPDGSLFNEYEMNSIDLIDFVYEIKSKGSLELPDGALWPINGFMNDTALYNADQLEWTDAGLQKLNDVLHPQTPIDDRSIKINQLYAYFTLNYVLKRLSDIKAAS